MPAQNRRKDSGWMPTLNAHQHTGEVFGSAKSS